MDDQMPEMDGFETTASIREQEKKTDGHIPIVALTAHAMKGDAERCLSTGMDAYVSKSIRFHETGQRRFCPRRRTSSGCQLVRAQGLHNGSTRKIQERRPIHDSVFESMKPSEN